jgi:pimeloyl-ACP methyl ester carboxylesterase
LVAAKGCARFISGTRDWGVHQAPGNLERMRDVICTNLIGFHLLEGAGHWVQQEKAGEVAKLLLGLLEAPIR